MAYQPLGMTLRALEGTGQTIDRLGALDAAAKERAIRTSLAQSELAMRGDELAANNRLGIIQAENTAKQQVAANSRYAAELEREKARDADERQRYADMKADREAKLAEEKRQNSLLPMAMHMYNAFREQNMSADEANKAIADFVQNDPYLYKLIQTPVTLANLSSGMTWAASQARQEKATRATVAKAEQWGKVSDDAKYMSGLDLKDPANQKFLRMKQAEYRSKGLLLVPTTKVEYQIRTVMDKDGNEKTEQVPITSTAFMPVPLEHAAPEEKQADFDRHARSLAETNPWMQRMPADYQASLAKQTYDAPEKEGELLAKWGGFKDKKTGARLDGMPDTKTAARGVGKSSGATATVPALPSASAAGLKMLPGRIPNATELSAPDPQFKIDPRTGAMYQVGAGPVPPASGVDMYRAVNPEYQGNAISDFAINTAADPLTYLALPAGGTVAAFKGATALGKVAGRGLGRLFESDAQMFARKAAEDAAFRASADASTSGINRPLASAASSRLGRQASPITDRYGMETARINAREGVGALNSDRAYAQHLVDLYEQGQAAERAAAPNFVRITPDMVRGTGIAELPAGTPVQALGAGLRPLQLPPSSTLSYTPNYMDNAYRTFRDMAINSERFGTRFPPLAR